MNRFDKETLKAQALLLLLSVAFALWGDYLINNGMIGTGWVFCLFGGVLLGCLVFGKH